MPRPLLKWSIDQLEAEFERAQDAADIAALGQLQEELNLRTTPRAIKLREAVNTFLGHGPPRDSSAKQKKQNQERPECTSSTFAPKAKKSSFQPTEEQLAAINHFQTGSNLKINAFAGTGKTSTLELIANRTNRRGQYIAFNRDIVRDAKTKFPDTVNCSTTHGLAFRATPSKYKSNSDKMTRRISANQLAELLKLKRWQVDRSHILQPRSQGFLILETVRRFAQSASNEPLAEHVPRHGSLAAASEPTLKAVTEFALHAARHVWERMKDPDDPVPLGHDGYLKLWAQSEPTIAADFILLDEAQDTNPVVLDLLKKQSAQMIYVGDKYQQIYEWRGAVNAMEKIATEGSTYLTTSFRFGPKIAEFASKLLILMNEHRPVRGNPKMESRVGQVLPTAILARTNASTIAALIENLDAGKKPHLVGGTDEIMEMLRGVQDLKEGRQSTVPDFFGFDSWNDVVQFAKSGEGDHLLTFVNLVEGRGERQLMWALNRSVDEAESDIVISTAHKAKGREWKHVKLMDDFLRSQPAKKSDGAAIKEQPLDPAELRLFYVAFTRAKEAIEVPPATLAIFQKR